VSVFFPWLLFSHGSELQFHLFAESCIMYHTVLATCLCHAFFHYVVPKPACTSKVTHVKYNFTTWLDIASNCLCPAQAIIYTLPDVMLQWASDVKRTRLAVGLCHKLCLARVCCEVLPCVPRSFQRSPRVRHIRRTRFEHSDITVVRKICADLVGLNDSQKHGTICICQEWTSFM
jgi:hypothetical protein